MGQLERDDTSSGGYRLEEVVSTSELSHRPSRPPQYEAENRLLISLAQAMAECPEELFQRVADGALALTGAESAGVSILESGHGKEEFRWRAASGLFQPFLGATLPRKFSPCGTVLDRNASQLMSDPARFWPYIDDLQKPIAEVLLVPIHTGGIPIGTVWVVSHTGARRFDSEDERLVSSLSRFVSAAATVQANLIAAETSNRTKDRHFAFLAHELRGPLTPALLAAASIAADESLPSATRDDAEIIRRNIDLATHLADDLLDASRIAHGKLQLRREPVDLHGLIDAAVTMCAVDADAKGIILLPDFQAGSATTSADPSKLMQVWCNLLKNAIKFSPPKSLIRVRTECIEDSRVRVSITDSGVGMEAETLGKIFNLYEQGGSATTREHGGLGLGLAICKGIVDAHGGVIRATSEGRGHGATFFVEFETISERPVKLPEVSKEAGDTRPLKILLVDDHLDTLRLMSRLLETLDHNVATAAGVTDALSLAEGQEFDLLISDVGLQDGTGNDLMRELLKRKPVKGIALTGYGTKEDIALTREAGFTAHLTKPVNFEQLQTMIDQVTSGTIEKETTLRAAVGY